MSGAEQPLNAGSSTSLQLVNGVVTGQVSLGPDQGPPTWDVNTVIYSTSRPGRSPIPRIEVFLDDIDNPAQRQMVSYDGSLGQGSGSCRLSRGQHLIAVWTGGTVGDTAFLTVTGTRKA